MVDLSELQRAGLFSGPILSKCPAALQQVQARCEQLRARRGQGSARGASGGLRASRERDRARRPKLRRCAGCALARPHARPTARRARAASPHVPTRHRRRAPKTRLPRLKTPSTGGPERLHGFGPASLARGARDAAAAAERGRGRAEGRRGPEGGGDHTDGAAPMNEREQNLTWLPLQQLCAAADGPANWRWRGGWRSAGAWQGAGAACSAGPLAGACASRQPAAPRLNAKPRRHPPLRQADVSLHLPMRVGDYTDFYASKHHAHNCGVMFRDAAQALPRNWWAARGARARGRRPARCSGVERALGRARKVGSTGGGEAAAAPALAAPPSPRGAPRLQRPGGVHNLAAARPHPLPPRRAGCTCQLDTTAARRRSWFRGRRCGGLGEPGRHDFFRRQARAAGGCCCPQRRAAAGRRAATWQRAARGGRDTQGPPAPNRRAPQGPGPGRGHRPAADAGLRRSGFRAGDGARLGPGG